MTDDNIKRIVIFPEQKKKDTKKKTEQRTKQITVFISFAGWLGVLVGSEIYYKYECRGVLYILFGTQNIICKSIESFQKPFLVGSFGVFGYLVRKHSNKAIAKCVNYFFLFI